MNNERIVLTSGQIAQLAAFAGRDNEPFEDQATLVVERCTDGHSGPGIYAHYEELPDEGAIHLDGAWPAHGSKWMPIETAPKDDGKFLVWVHAEMHGEHCEGGIYVSDESYVDIGWWREGSDPVPWEYVDHIDAGTHDVDVPTHWMPLPEPPK